MRRLSAPGIVVPVLLSILGAMLIVTASLPLDPVVVGLPDISDIPEPSFAPVTPAPSPSGSGGETAAPSPSPKPPPANWVAVQIQVKAVGLNVLVKQSRSRAIDLYPRHDAVYIWSTSSQPGRGTNTFIIGHAELYLFKRLWNAVLGDEVKVLMSDGRVLHYVITEIHPNQSCPDPLKEPDPSPPLALRLAGPACLASSWTRRTDHEVLTLHTSQGFNRNYGEFIVIAEPVR